MVILSLQAIFKHYLLKNIEWNWSLFVQNFILMAYEFKDRLPLYEVYFLETMGDYQNKINQHQVKQPRTIISKSFEL